MKMRRRGGRRLQKVIYTGMEQKDWNAPLQLGTPIVAHDFVIVLFVLVLICYRSFPLEVLGFALN